MKRALHDYFQLDVDLKQCYKDWSAVDDNFRRKCEKVVGLRILRIDPVENLFSFICSSNNNIPRITQMVDKLATNFGEYVGDVDGEKFHDFPTVRALVGSEQKLRSLGFGYRAKYIATSAEQIIEMAKENYNPNKNNNSNSDVDIERLYLYSLREKPFHVVRQTLTQLCGVGPKIADCVCLFGMDKSHVVPVDTHVRSIAERDYGWRSKSNEEIQEKFQNLFGTFAGWAHCVLFAADLKKR